ncbi:MAG: orotidine-5'-phosphate decarboxylase [Candidatus Levybacteria bacterium]|nr:orotidine-5'-phosphate decarboxylase [Candidatus Levybacteria bacterium]
MASLFISKLEKQWAEDKFVCIGLDPIPEKLPKKIKSFFEFNKSIIDATYDIVLAYKPNSAFYEALGTEGIKQLKKTVDYIKKNHTQIPTILDAKRADIGSTNEGYATYAFDYLGVDAITIQPYFGQEAVEPFLKRKDKGVIVLARTSNPGAGEFQDIKNKNGEPLYLTVAQKVSKQWNINGNCCLVVGATYPNELSIIRKAVGDIPFLIPGIGAQGADVEKTVRAGMDSRGWGMIIHSSRAIIFASSGADFAQAARQKAKELNDAINLARGVKKTDSKKLTSAQKKLSLHLFDIGAVKFGAFKLKLHDKHPNAPLSPIYIDLRVLRRTPAAKDAAIKVYKELVRPLKFDLIADIPTAATPLASSLSDKLKIGMITPRADKKTHGSGAKVDGMLSKDKGKWAILIDDLVTRADSKLEAAKTLRGSGVKVRDVVVLIDRQQGGEKEMAKNKLKLHSAFTMQQMLDYFLEVKRLSKKEYDTILQGIESLNNYLKP